MTVILSNIIVLKTSGGKIFKLDRVDKMVTIYATEEKWNTDDPVGSLPSSEILELINFVKGQTTNE